MRDTAPPSTPMNEAVLPAGIRSRFVNGVNGLRMHVLEAGFERPQTGEGERPCILLLHGFPEIAYSWRKVMLPLAAAGYHVVAPDQRGYGRTTGWDADYDGDLAPFRFLNIVRDSLALISALGHRSVAMVVGHDFGAPIAGCCALARPDVFRSVAMMSAPFTGPPALPFAMADEAARPEQETSFSETLPVVRINDELAALQRPRKHYQWYYTTRQANEDMLDCPQGVHAFLRAYFHMKSADWPENRPFPLASWTADEFAKMPTYYVMDRDRTMAETVMPEMPSAAEIAACRWLTEEDLAIYAAEYARTSFQGGLQWYRCMVWGQSSGELALLSGRTIDVPSIFVAGSSDWGPFQGPGSLERMQHEACTRMAGCHLIDGAGHWVQQEQPERVVELLLSFLREQG